MSEVGSHHGIEVQAQALGPLLFAGVATSVMVAETRRRGLEHSKYPHLAPILVRAELREYLEATALPNGWIVGGDPRLMGQLLLENEDLNLRMRVLKERRATYPGGIPPAGKNRARRQAWTAAPLDLVWPSPNLTVRSAAAPADRPGELVRLLLVWDFVAGTNLREFTLRVVHPTEPGIYGKAVPCDLVLDIKDGGEIFKSLEFTGSPQDDDLFGRTVEIDEEGDVGS